MSKITRELVQSKFYAQCYVVLDYSCYAQWSRYSVSSLGHDTLWYSRILDVRRAAECFGVKVIETDAFSQHVLERMKGLS